MRSVASPFVDAVPPAPFSRHSFAGRARGEVSLQMEWIEAVTAPFFEHVLKALVPAVGAGDFGIAQTERGQRRSRKAKLDIAKIAAAIESCITSISLVGRPGRGYASFNLGQKDSGVRYGTVPGSFTALRVAIATDPYDPERERADAEVLAQVFDALLPTGPLASAVTLETDSLAEYSCQLREA